jgi:hypothetical protein
LAPNKRTHAPRVGARTATLGVRLRLQRPTPRSRTQRTRRLPRKTLEALQLFIRSQHQSQPQDRGRIVQPRKARCKRILHHAGALCHSNPTNARNPLQRFIRRAQTQQQALVLPNGSGRMRHTETFLHGTQSKNELRRPECHHFPQRPCRRNCPLARESGGQIRLQSARGTRKPTGSFF